MIVIIIVEASKSLESHRSVNSYNIGEVIIHPDVRPIGNTLSAGVMAGTLTGKSFFEEEKRSYI